MPCYMQVPGPWAGFDPLDTSRRTIVVPPSTNTTQYNIPRNLGDDLTVDARNSTFTFAAGSWLGNKATNMLSFDAPGPWPSNKNQRDYTPMAGAGNLNPIQNDKDLEQPARLVVLMGPNSLIDTNSNDLLYWDEHDEASRGHSIHMRGATGSWFLVQGGKVRGHDGIRPFSDGWNVRGVWFDHIRDDMFENDSIKTGLIDDCYGTGHSFLSIEVAVGAALGKTVVIRNTLIELLEQYTRGDNQGDGYPGHLRQVASVAPLELAHGNFKGWGHLWKQVKGSHATIICDNVSWLIPSIFSVPGVGNALNFPDSFGSSYNNCKIYWMGGGAYPGPPVPPGITIINGNRAPFDADVAAWKTKWGW